MTHPWGRMVVPAIAVMLALGFGAPAVAQQTRPRIIPWDEQLAPPGEQQPVDEPYAEKDAEDLAAGRAVRGYPRDEDDEHEHESEGSGQQVVSGRSLLTPEERASFRSQMLQATPEQRKALWSAKHAELQRRASERGVTLAEPWLHRGAFESLHRELHTLLSRLAPHAAP